MTERGVPGWWQSATVFGLPVDQVALALGASLLAYLVMTVGLRLARSRLARIASHTRTRVDDAVVEVLGSTQGGLIALAALLIGLGLIDLSDRWATRVGQLWFIAVALQVALWVNRLITLALAHHFRHAAAETHSTATVSAAATLISWGVRTLLWAIVLLGMLSNLGVNITAFVASLGVGGIAVALAAQSILGDLFASVSIAVDKPFEVGDFIVLGSIAGTVENVGVKTTRIRSLGGEQIVMSNTELLKQTISNYKRLQQRRIVFGFGVTYETTAEQAAEIPAIVRAAVEASPRLRFDRAHFKAFGDSSLDIEAVYIVLDADYNLYMDEQQRINLALMRELAQRGIGFAFPARTVYFANAPQGAGAGSASAPARSAAATGPQPNGATRPS